MKVVSAELVDDKKVLLRMDIDVPVEEGKVADDFRLRAGLETLDLCLQHAKEVIVMGHIGRPKGEDPKYSVKPVVDWFEEKFAHIELPEGKLHILENLRFEEGESVDAPHEKVWGFARELASYGEVFINESFAAHHPAASTTILPSLLPHAVGLQFAKEVETILGVRNKPKKPLVAIIGGAKVEDKYEAVRFLSTIADVVLVGGLLSQRIKEQSLAVSENVLLGKNSSEGVDLSQETVEAFGDILKHAKQVIWSGPMGKYEEDGGIHATEELAKTVIDSGAESIVGGGDTIAALNKLGLLGRFSFVSTGGGAMLEYLYKGTLPTIEALR